MGLYGQRKSRCADAARELHMERTWMLSPIERIRLSLSLGRRLCHLMPDPPMLESWRIHRIRNGDQP